jgi:hypothetical protein
MANRLDTNPIYVDIFDAGDIVIAEKGVPVILRKIIMLSATDGDNFLLEDNDGNQIIHMSNNVGNADTTSEMYNDLRCNNGVVIDVSDCTGMEGNDGTDAVWIYLA